MSGLKEALARLREAEVVLRARERVARCWRQPVRRILQNSFQRRLLRTQHSINFMLLADDIQSHWIHMAGCCLQHFVPSKRSQPRKAFEVVYVVSSAKKQ